MQIAVFGAGLVGRRAAQFLAAEETHDIVLISHHRPVAPLAGVTTGVGWPHPAATNASIVVLATASPHQYALARQLVGEGRMVVSTASSPDQIEQLLKLNELAIRHETVLIVGAAYSPGVSTLLATHLARGFDEVMSIRTAHFGTGGPACAREHHHAFNAPAPEVRECALRTTRGGSGRELVWFPDPVGAADCYRAGLADPLVLQRSFGAVPRIEARQAATRRDRLTARLPMLRSPHPEGLVGAVWAEVRGRVDGRVEHRSMAATGAPATGAAAMAAAMGIELAKMATSGDASSPQIGCCSIVDFEYLVPFLVPISNRVRLWAYDGSQIAATDREKEPLHAARKWKLNGDIRTNTTIQPNSSREGR